MRETPIEAKTVPELCTEIFLAVLRVRSSGDIGGFEAFHSNTQKLFLSFEKQCKELGLEVEDINTAKYALAAFMDETVLNSSWPHKDQWANNSLQMAYFGTYLAGEIFYDKLENLRTHAESKPDLLEIYYLCLLLGFKGKYGFSGHEKLRGLIANVAGELDKVKPSTFEQFSPHWKISDSPHKRSNKLPRWIVLTCWGVVILALLLYIGLFLKVRWDADSLNKKIRNQTVSVEVRDDKSA